jgi:hypothetical protein
MLNIYHIHAGVEDVQQSAELELEWYRLVVTRHPNFHLIIFKSYHFRINNNYFASLLLNSNLFAVNLFKGGLALTISGETPTAELHSLLRFKSPLTLNAWKDSCAIFRNAVRFSDAFSNVKNCRLHLLQMV